MELVTGGNAHELTDDEELMELVTTMYHCGQNNYSFDALQAYCFGINIKL